jgi:hypothetical protein
MMFSRAYKTVVTVPPLVWVTIFLLLPYLLMFCYSFWSVSPAQTIVHAWNLDNYKELVQKTVYWQTLLRSMGIAARVMLFSFLLGYPLAYFLSFYAGKRKNLLYQMVIIPLWVSYLVRAYAWKTILGSDGVLNTLLQYVHLTRHPLVRRGADTHAYLYAVRVSTDLCSVGAYSSEPGGSFARSGRDADANFLENYFPAVDSRSRGGGNVCLCLEPRRFPGATFVGWTERHHDFEYCGQLVRCGLQLAPGRSDFAGHAGNCGQPAVSF